MNYLCQDCQRLLSSDGVKVVCPAYRVSRRSDGTPIRGIVNRLTVHQGLFCRACVDKRVDVKRLALRSTGV